MKVKRFPVMLSTAERKQFDDCPESIPWEKLEPHTWQALRNHGQQSLARLAERGGLGPDELVAIFERRPWRKMEMRDAVNRLKQLIGWGIGW